jgi:hypothetical protein
MRPRNERNSFVWRAVSWEVWENKALGVGNNRDSAHKHHNNLSLLWDNIFDGEEVGAG